VPAGHRDSSQIVRLVSLYERGLSNQGSDLPELAGIAERQVMGASGYGMTMRLCVENKHHSQDVAKTPLMDKA
jgi:hypothetical protein